MQKEQCVEYIRETQERVSCARACRLVGLSRSVMYYEKKLAVKDAHIKEIILLVMGTQRKGRKKVIPLVQKQDPNIGQSRIRRVYQNEGLSLRSRMCKQRPKKDPNPMEKTFARNEEWAMDFMHDSLSNGRAIRTLTLVDHYNRQCLGIEIALPLPSMLIWILASLRKLTQCSEVYCDPWSELIMSGLPCFLIALSRTSVWFSFSRPLEMSQPTIKAI